MYMPFYMVCRRDILGVVRAVMVAIKDFCAGEEKFRDTLGPTPVLTSTHGAHAC
tara:strand:- start:155 stop:316 length:162 start_codon:yes stop_codon:yes gene_type:complete